jgi:hypothetical protein
MNQVMGRGLALAVLGLALTASPATATPIITILTSASDFEAALPPGSEPEDFLVGAAEFGDAGPGGTDLDFNVTYLGVGSIVEVPDLGNPVCLGIGAECFWSTTGSVSFHLDVGAANFFGISYLELAPGQAAPLVSMTLVDDSVFDVGPLLGGSFENPGELIFGFISTEPFKGVSLSLPDADPLMTQFAVFADVPSVPEPTTLLLVATGALLSSRRAFRSHRQKGPRTGP